MAVAMQAQGLQVARSLEASPHSGDRHVNGAAVRGVEVGRNKAVREQPVAWLFAEARDIERRSVGEARPRADRVNAPDEPPKPLACRPIFELRGATAAVR